MNELQELQIEFRDFVCIVCGHEDPDLNLARIHAKEHQTLMDIIQLPGWVREPLVLLAIVVGPRPLLLAGRVWRRLRV